MPAAELDRFMFQRVLDYPALRDEIGIVKATTLYREVRLDTLMREQEIKMFQHLVRQIPR